MPADLHPGRKESRLKRYIISDNTPMTKGENQIIDRAVGGEKVNLTIDLALSAGIAFNSGIMLGNCLGELYRCVAEDLGVLRARKPNIRAFPPPCGRWTLLARDEGTLFLGSERGCFIRFLVRILYTDAPEVVRRAEPLTEEFLHRLEAQYMEARREDTISKIRQIEKSASRGKDEGTSRGSPSL